ncbi:43 kDa receptor-associated protein of the synapse-like [Glandiceps talaboti]
MGQKMVRGLIKEGLKLYKAHHQDEAVHKWKRALSKAKDVRDKFVALGYLVWAHCDWGKYREMLQFSIKQIDVANEADNSDMRAEAYLNLARSNEKLCEYHKAISYCRHALSQPCDNKVIGQVYLCLGNAYVGFSDFQKAFEYLHKTLQIAQKSKDKSLECNTYGSLGELYAMLKDYDRALQFHLRAEELVQKFGDDWSTKFRTLSRLNLATPYRKLEKLNDALECTEDAMKLALQLRDRSVQGRCLCLFADIHRNRQDYERALPRYEAALNITIEIGDKVGQIHVLYGMAKNMLVRKQYRQALEYNEKALDLSETIGNRMLALRVQWQLEQLYNTLSQYEEGKKYNRVYKQGIHDLGLTCGVCNQSIAEKQAELEPLQCWHLFHAHCLESYSCVSKGCPDCRRTLVKPVFV